VNYATSDIPPWEQLLESARCQTPACRIRRPGQSPSIAPIPSSWHKLVPGEKPFVLLYRDSNSWCPFCERVWFALEEKQIPFETEFIDLSNKPQSYLDLVPTALVPAAKIDGNLVYESKDIIKGNPRFPRINAWFAALHQRPAYHRVKSDSITNNLLLRRRWGAEPIGNLLPLDTEITQVTEYRAEAAERLSDNHDLAIADILKNSGAQALVPNGDEATVREAINWHLRLLVNYLLDPTSTPLPWGRIGGKDNADPFAAAVGAITLTYIRNRICAPRDMSAGAATALRAAADILLTALY
jgi:glutaredoxin